MGANYDITSVNRTIDLGQGGTGGYVYEVAFVTKPHNGKGAVLIPVAAYTPEEAATMVADEAAKIERTFAL